MSTMFHCTSPDHRSSILRLGLRGDMAWNAQAAKESGDPDWQMLGSIYFCTKRRESTDATDVYEVSVDGLQIEPDYTTEPTDPDDTWWVTYDDVEPSRLQLIEQQAIADEKCAPSNF